jgi:TonB family protein
MLLVNFDAARTWEGQVVDGKFPLLHWVGGTDRSAVFLTELGASKAAIKLVAADELDANLQLLRWQQAAQMSHPHLLRLLTQGRCEIGDTRLVYVVMEYAEENLSEILGQRALTTGEARDLLEPVLEALAYLHREGLVHGRIQPSNILAQGNQIKLSADRIAVSGDARDATRRESVYDAPELKAEPVSHSADIWSLGMTLVEALTQQPVVHEPSLYKEVHIPAMPEPFGSIARDCLRRDPGQRCTIAQIRARLEATPPAVVPKSPADGKPSRVRLLIPFAAIVLLAAVFVGPKLLSRHNESSAAKAGKTEPRATPNPSNISPTVKAPAKPAATRTASKGEVARQVLPPVPVSARNTIRGRIKVAVLVEVDPSGKVASAKLTSAGPSRYFANLALKAAQQWQFTPPLEDGQPAPSAWLLRFQFGRNGTQVFPTQGRH